MEKLPINTIAQWIGADFHGEGEIDTFTNDSRAVTPGCLFVAMEGEVTDGHKYINQALEKGAAYAVAHKPGDYHPGERVIYVKNTREVLLSIASHYRDSFDLKVVGVTGSVGKTTTKEFIWTVLSAKYHTLKNLGNQNTEVGLPQTIFRLERSHQAAVLEMGMCALGEIEELTRVAKPDIGVITNVGVAHLERLGSRENILKAKTEIVLGMRPGSPLLLNGDNDLLGTYENPDFKIIRYGIHNPACQVRAEGIVQEGTSTRFLIRWGEESIPAVIPTIGEHNVLNALAAYAVGRELDISPQDCAKALSSYQTAGMRQKIVEHQGYTVVEDCYNANPDSMRAALLAFAAYPCKGRKIALLSDMLEIGPNSYEDHKEMGRLCAQLGFDQLWATGRDAKGYAEGASEAGLQEAFFCPDKMELTRSLAPTLREGDLVWVKGSRGMEMEEIFPILYRP